MRSRGTCPFDVEIARARSLTFNRRNVCFCTTSPDTNTLDFSLFFFNTNHVGGIRMPSACATTITGRVICPRKSACPSMSSSHKVMCSTSTSNSRTLNRNSSFHVGSRLLYTVALRALVFPNCSRTNGSLRPLLSLAAKLRACTSCTMSLAAMAAAE